MTGASFHIGIDDRAVMAALAGLDFAARDAGPAFDEIGSYMVSSTQDRFEQGVDPDGTPWPPSERAAAEGGQTLIDSGILFGSLTHDAGSDYAEIGTNVIYGATHQFGRGPIPARAYLGVSGDDETEITAILGDWLEEGWHR